MISMNSKQSFESFQTIFIGLKLKQKESNSSRLMLALESNDLLLEQNSNRYHVSRV